MIPLRWMFVTQVQAVALRESCCLDVGAWFPLAGVSPSMFKSSCLAQGPLGGAHADLSWGFSITCALRVLRSGGVGLCVSECLLYAWASRLHLASTTQIRSGGRFGPRMLSFSASPVSMELTCRAGAHPPEPFSALATP